MRTQTGSRWIVLGADGRHVSLGRTEPSEAEITAANDALAAQGLSGWLVRMQGEYYRRNSSNGVARRIENACECNRCLRPTIF